MTDDRASDLGGDRSLSHGYKARTAQMVVKATAMDAKGSETNGYKPATSQVRPTPPPPPPGEGGGSK